MIVSGFMNTRKEPDANMRTTVLPMPDRCFLQQWQGISSFKFYVSVVSVAKLQAINGDQQTN